MQTIVHLVRHGEVDNPDGILYGRKPGFGLSELGHKQAVLVAEALATHRITHVVASPLDRAQQTAEPIAAAHRLDVHTHAGLIEAANDFEGLRVAPGDGVLRSPEHWAKLRNPLRPSWGEPYRQIAHRMLAAVHRALEVGGGEGSEVAVVSHQLPIWTLRRFLEGSRLWHDPRRRQCSLASLTSLVFADDELARIVYSEPAGATDARVTGA